MGVSGTFFRALFPAVASLAAVLLAVGVLEPLTAAPASAASLARPMGDPSKNAPLPVVTGKVRPGEKLSSSGGVGISSSLPIAAPLPAHDLSVPSNGSSTFDAKTSKLVDHSEYADIYKNADGTMTQQLSLTPVNVKDSAGKWVPISTTVTKRSDGGFDVANHPLSPSFSANAGSADGVFSVSRSKYKVSFSLNGTNSAAAGTASARDRAAAGASASDSVSYTGVLPGADLTYKVETGTVKEAIVLNAPPTSVAPSYTWTIHAPGLSAVKDADGDINLIDASGAIEFQIPTPVMSDSSAVDGVRGAAFEDIATTLAQVAGHSGDWALTLNPDPAWLNDPARVYPVALDPSVNEGEAYQNAYESNGTHLTGYTNIGNSRAGGDTIWRTVETYNYAAIFGNELTGVDDVEQYSISGTTNAVGASFWTAGCFGFNCASSNLANTTIGSGTSGYGVQSGQTMFNWFANAVDYQSNGTYFLLGGDESSNYTYKRVNSTLQLAYVPMATVGSVAQSIGNGYEISPQGGSTGSVTPILQVSSSDQSGSALNYNFVVSNAAGAQVWSSGWTASTSVQIPAGTLAAGTGYSWRAYGQDGYLAAASYQISTPSYSWTTATAPTIPPGSAAPSPADQSIVATTTPTLIAPVATNSGSTLSYSIRIASGRDGVSGQLAQSTGLTPSAGQLSWQVPAATLRDGGAYTWSEVAIDQYGNSWTMAANRVTVSLRVSNPGPAPTDSAGPVTVNLANGNLAASFTTPTVQTVGGAMGYGFNYNSQAASNAGLTATYYTDPGTAAPFAWSAGVPQVTRTDAQIDFNWNTVAPAPNLATVTNGVLGNAVNFQATWTGFVTPPVGSYNFGFTYDDGVQLFLNNGASPTIDDWSTGWTGTPNWATSSAQTLVVSTGPSGNTATLGGVSVPLPLPITVKYYQGPGAANIDFLVENTGAPSTAQTVPASWFTTTAQALPAGWQGSGAIAGDADEYVSASNQGGYVTLTDVGGGTHTYTQTISNGVPTGGYTPPAGESGVLSLDANNSLTFTDEAGTNYLFNQAGQVTQITSPQDAGKPAAPIPSYVNTSTLSNALRSISDPLSSNVPDPPSSNEASPAVYSRQVLFGYSSDTVALMTAGSANPSSSTANACTVPSGYTAAPPGMICVIQYPDGTQTQLVYDANGNLAEMIAPGSTVTNFGYTYVGATGTYMLNAVRSPLENDWLAANPTQTPSGLNQTTIGYDSRGRATAVTLPAPDGVTASKQPAKTYTYPPALPAGLATATSYVDVAGLNPPTSGGGNGHAETVTYTATLQEVTASSALGLTTTTAFSSDDNPLTTITAQGKESSTVYDSLKRPTDSYGPAPTSCFPALAAGAQNGVAPGACSVTPPHSSTAYDGGLQGLNGVWYNNATLSGVPAAYSLGIPSQVAGASMSTPTNGGAINVDWGSTSGPFAGMNQTNWTAQFTGTITFPAAGTYTLYTYADDGTQLWLNDSIVINNLASSSAHYAVATVPFTATAGQVARIRLNYLQLTGASHLELNWATPGTSVPSSPSSDIPVPGVDLSPDYSLATTSTVSDSVPSGVSGLTGSQVSNQVTNTNYSSAADGPWLGLPQSTTVDPTGDGNANPVNLTSNATYETPGSGYLRKLTGTLPAGASTATTAVYYPTTAGYGAVLGLTSPVCNVPLTTPQYGMLETSTGPSNSSGTSIATTTVYDTWGRVAGQKQTGDTDWSCTTYDSRGRITQQTQSGYGLVASRTVTNNYAVGGDPLTSSVSDSSTDTVTTVTDLLGRTTSYTDALGTVSVYLYESQNGRLHSVATTPSGGSASTQVWHYDADGKVTDTSLDGTTLATPSYDATGLLQSVAYSNGTSLSGVTYGATGSTDGISWSFPAGQAAVNDTVIRSQAGRVLRDTLTDGSTTETSQYSYDGAGRLIQAAIPGHTLTYGYATSAGCGANTAAGADSNRTSFSDAHSVNGATSTWTTGYCYDNADRLTGTSTTNPPAGAAPLAGSSVNMTGPNPTLAYDAHGNTTSIADESLQYDAADRETQTTLTGGTSVGYKYDPSGRLIKRTATTPSTTSSASLAVDAQVSADSEGGWGSSVTTAPISTSGPNELLVALVSADGPQYGQTLTVTGGGLSWTQAVQSNQTQGDAEVWTAHATQTLSGVRVTSTESAGSRPQSLSVVALTGANGVGATAHSSLAGAATVSLTTTAVGSMVFAAGVDVSDSSARTPGGGQTVIHEDREQGAGEDFWAQRVNATTASVGSSATITDSADGGWNLAEVEVVPAAAGVVGIDTSVSVDEVPASLVSPALTTSSSSETLVAFVSVDGWDGGGTATVSGAGLGWSLVARETGQPGDVEIWTAHASAPLTGVSVTAALTHEGGSHSLTVLALSGALGVGASSHVSGFSSAPSLSLTTTVAGSMVFGVGNDKDDATARTLSSGQSLVHEDSDSGWGEDYWVQRVAGAVAVAGSSVTIGDTAPSSNDQWNLAAVEVVPAGTVTVPSSTVTTEYSYSGGGSGAWGALTGAGTLSERDVVLPGGVSVTLSGSGGVWAYPNLHGDNMVTTNAAGVRVGQRVDYDPFGDPIDPATGNIGTVTANDSGPHTTATSGVSTGWEGSHQKLDETVGDISTIQMGARQYVPLLGRFLSVDPIPGGNANDYNYPNDPVTDTDLGGDKKHPGTKTYYAKSPSGSKRTIAVHMSLSDFDHVEGHAGSWGRMASMTYGYRRQSRTQVMDELTAATLAHPDSIQWNAKYGTWNYKKKVYGVKEEPSEDGLKTQYVQYSTVVLVAWDPTTFRVMNSYPEEPFRREAP